MESVEEFLARGGKIERIDTPPRAEKCSAPFGATAAPVYVRHILANPDLRRSTFSKGVRRERG